MAARNAASAGLVIPAPTRRPGSATFADVYGGLDFGGTTVTAGDNSRAATAPQAAPISLQGVGPDFLRQPAGVLVVLIAIVAIWSYLDR